MPFMFNISLLGVSLTVDDSALQRNQFERTTSYSSYLCVVSAQRNLFVHAGTQRATLGPFFYELC